MKRREFNSGIVAITAGSMLAAPSLLRAATMPEVVLGVGGKPLLYYLPLTVTERLGYFQKAGVKVTINDLGSGSKALQALVGGSTDVAVSDYAHTIYMQLKGQDVRAIVELGRLPGIVVGVRTELADRVNTAADFKGLKLGCTGPGSISARLPQYAMVKAGLKADDCPIIGVGSGAGAIASVIQGKVDLISHLDPAITKMEEEGLIKVIIDTRTEQGTLDLFGGLNPAATCYTTESFITKKPEAAQKLVNAFLLGLDWLMTATPSQVADLVPPEYLLGDRALYEKAVKAVLPTYSRDGICDTKGMESAYGMLKLLDPSFKDAEIDLSRTFEPRFVKAAS